MGYIAKDDLLFADTLYKGIIEKDVVAAQQAAVAIQAFMTKPVRMLKKKIEAFSVSTDFAQLTQNAFTLTIESDNFDMGWEAAYRTVPLDPKKNFWTIYNVINGIQFYKMPEGGRVKMDGMTGSKTTAYVDYYGGALGFTDHMIRYREIPAMVDIAAAFRNKFFAQKADNHYALLAAAAAFNTTAYQGVAGDGVTRRVLLTLNRAAFTLGNRCKDKGYGDMANAPLIFYANPIDEEKIEAAFKTVTADVVAARENGTAITQRPIRRVYTYNSNVTANHPILVLPGQKIQKADGMQPTTYVAPVDPFTLNQSQAVWAIYGAAIADTDQVERVDLV
jgi:hypothetical protein